MTIASLPLYVGPLILAAITLGAALLARRSPAWRRLAWCLAALTAIDAARMVTLPRAMGRAWGWWQADVALVAVWPAAMAWGLRLGGRHVTADGPRGSSPRGASASHQAAAHAWPIVAGLVYAVALGIARPYLPAAVYLAGLAVPRVALAGIWAGAVWRMARGGRRDEGPGCWLPHAAPVPEPSSAAPGIEPGNSPLTGSGVSSFPLLRPAHPTPSARLAQVCALVLAAGDVACALAPWSRVVVGVPPPWWVAQALTLASCAGAACVMGWAALRSRAARSR